MTHRRPSAPAGERALLVLERIAAARGAQRPSGQPIPGVAPVEPADAAGASGAPGASGTACASDAPGASVVLEGFHALKHALRFGAAVEAAATSDPDGLVALARELAPDVADAVAELATPVSREQLRALAPRLPHTEVLAVARRPTFSAGDALAARPDRPVVLLEDPRHLGNVGAVVRVAAAADAAAVLTTGERDPWDPAAVRGAAGLQFALPVGSVGEDLPGVAPRPLVALDPEGAPLGVEPLPAGAVLAFGTERHGLSPELLARADRRIAIPMRAGVSSLNLATAVAVVLYTAPGG